MDNQLTAIDLFCGVGGLTHGFILEGINVAAGIDIDVSCKYPYEYNNKNVFIDKDIRELSSSDIESLYLKNSLRILAGCAPCQPFSTYNRKNDKTSDEKWPLLYEFSRLIQRVVPEIVSMENVPRLEKQSVFADFIKALTKLNYNVNYRIVYCPDYGIPQTRKRLVLLASRLGKIELLQPDKNKLKKNTVKNAIGHLESLEAGQISSKDPLHRAKNLSPLNLKRIKNAKPGGTWREWDSELVADCHRKPGLRTFGSVYGRMEWDKPAPTITTQFCGFGNGRFGHPEQNRAISLREGALLQTFPENYRFYNKPSEIAFTKMGQMIGNAVPVELGRIIARSIKKHIREVVNERT